ncbi:MAG TPA: hypothetical protein VLH16_05975, partial [Bacteroidales bacterium]|nr:hypothetical protein [Bacteroidales bacterium]
MESKLQELTNKIYSEGIEKANKEAEAILTKAREAADALISSANQEAAAIIDASHREAQELKKNVNNELAMAARQSISALKQKITDLITAQLIAEPVHEAFADRDFLKKTIEIVLKNWDKDSTVAVDVALILPASEEQQLGKYFAMRAHELLRGGLQIKFDDKIGNGFRI